MLVEAAAVLVRLPAVLALQLARRSFLFLGQACAVASSTHLQLGLLGSLKGREGRAIDHSTAAAKDALFGHSVVMRQAARHALV